MGVEVEVGGEGGESRLDQGQARMENQYFIFFRSSIFSPRLNSVAVIFAGLVFYAVFIDFVDVHVHVDVASAAFSFVLLFPTVRCGKQGNMQESRRDYKKLMGCLEDMCSTGESNVQPIISIVRTSRRAYELSTTTKNGTAPV